MTSTDPRIERLELAVQALRTLSPHPERFAYHKPSDGRYVQIKQAPPDVAFVRHILGRALLGAVSGDEDGKTTSVGIDLDAHTNDQKPAEAARRFVAACRAWNVPILVHTSKSGTGCHVRTLFNEAVPVHLARAMYIYLAEVSALGAAYDKVWPCARGYSVLALPLQANYMRTTGGCIALVPDTLCPIRLSDQVEAILEAETMSMFDASQVLFGMGIETEEMACQISGNNTLDRTMQHATVENSDGGLVFMLENCLAVERLEREAATIPYEFWFSMLTNFRPFLGGQAVFDAYCRLDAARYKPRDNARMWKSVSGGPRFCANLDRGWECSRLGRCGCRAPAALPMALKRSGVITQQDIDNTLARYAEKA